MIPLPIRTVLNSISDWVVFYFKDINHNLPAPLHYYVVIPITSKDVFVLCKITSQVERKKQYFKNNINALNSLIILNKAGFPFLTKEESVIDCNDVEVLTDNDFCNRVNTSYEYSIKERNIFQDMKTKITAAIKNSPRVKGYIKSLL